MVAPGFCRQLDEFVRTLVEENVSGPGARVSIWFGDVEGAASYSADEQARHYAASTMKLPLLVAAYRRHERGEIDLDASVQVHNDFRSVADGSPFSLDQDDDQDDETWALVGSTVSLRRLVRSAIVRSGNLATNLVLEQVGAGEVARVLVDAGCSSDTVLSRGIEDRAAREAGLDNLVTAHDLALVMAGIGDRNLGSEQMCADVEEVLAGQEHREGIPAGLPLGTYVANKTGSVAGVAHDVALVRPDSGEPFILVVLTTMDVSEQKANGVIAQISRAIWEGRRR
jgi:beta-lactamase class A